jgi:hypothetical protein
MASKYDQIANHLRHQPGPSCEMRFSQIEAILGCALPPSARAWTTWWRGTPSNSPTHVQAKYGWYAAGWSVEEVSIEDEVVKFRKPSTHATT